VKEVKVQLRRRVEVPGFLKPVLGDGFSAEQLTVNHRGLFVEGGDGLSIFFDERVNLYKITWLSLIVDDWDAVLSKVQDGKVRGAVERLASAAKAVRLALEGGCAAQPPKCGVWRFSERYKRLLVDAAETLLEEERAGRAPHETVAGRFAAWWKVPLFDNYFLRTLHGLSTTLRVEREVDAPEWLADIVVAPPYTVEAVRADEAGVSVYVKGRAEQGEKGTLLTLIADGSTSVHGLILAAFFTEDEDWARLTAEWRKLLDALGETHCRVRAAALLCRLLT